MGFIRLDINACASIYQFMFSVCQCWIDLVPNVSITNQIGHFTETVIAFWTMTLVGMSYLPINVTKNLLHPSWIVKA